MNTQVSFRQMDTSPALRDYATGKLERIVDKYVSGQVDASVVMSVQKYWHIADFTLNIKNLTVKGQERSEDMYSSIDLALAKIEKQLRRHKDRIRSHKASSGEGRTFKMGVLSMHEPEDDFAPEGIELLTEPPSEAVDTATAGMIVDSGAGEEVEVEASPADDDGIQVLKLKELASKSMTLEEAVIQLDLLEEREFYVFTSDKTNTINVVYKRRDGKIGLIET